MKNSAALVALVLLGMVGTAAAQQRPPLLPEQQVAVLAGELSGETAKRNLEYITRFQRTRGSTQFRAAADYILERLRAYGLADAKVEQLPADGRIFYGTQRSRPAWDAEFAELWELRREGDTWVQAERVASWDAMPMTLAQDSESAEVTAELVDVGNGTSEQDYAGKDVRGKLVLVGAQPGAAVPLAVERFGAAGLVSYAQNQRTAWWGEDENLIRWGHLETFAPAETFAFMVSLQRARAYRQRLARGETIRLHATVRAGQHPGSYDIVTATIPGADPNLRQEEIAFTCHLDHPRPGANDNASGCATILEVARALAKLMGEGRLPRPARTIRFIWPPEIEGSIAILNARPEMAARIKAVVHMDMVGGGPTTKAVFHVRRGPASLPSFVNDVAEAFAEFANQQTLAFASTGSAAYPLNAPEGGKEPLRAQLAEFDMGSDHQVFAEGSFRISAIYFADWPDRYIHTNFDSAANIDPTKLKRAAFIGAATAYFLASTTASDAAAIWQQISQHSLTRTARMRARRSELPAGEAANLTRFHFWFENELVNSMGRFFAVQAEVRREAAAFLDGLARADGGVPAAPPETGLGASVFLRNPEVKGPMSGFGYDYFTDKYGAERAQAIRLLSYTGLRGSGGDYGYEVLNLVDGKRSAQQIRDAASAIYGPVPLEVVVEYLRALESIGVVKQAP